MLSACSNSNSDSNSSKDSNSSTNSQSQNQSNSTNETSNQTSDHGHDITADIVESSVITLSEDGKVSGAATGTWKLDGDHNAVITIDGVDYNGVFLREYDESMETQVMTFSALSDKGITIWGSHVAIAK